MKRVLIVCGILFVAGAVSLSHVMLSAEPTAQDFKICHKGSVIAVTANGATTHLNKHADTDCVLDVPESVAPGDACGCNCGDPGQPACTP